MAASFVILRCGRRTDSEGQVLELLGDDFTLGRADTCALQTDSDVVSRHHASLQLVDQGWVIADLNSSNGTFVNDKRVETAEVRVGDKLMLGEAGPVYEVIALEGSAGGDDLESTRFLRVAERKPLDDGPEEQQEQAPPPPAPKPAPELEPVFSNETESAPLSIEPESDPEPPPLPEASPKPQPAATPPLKETAPAAATATKRGWRRFPYGMVAGIVFGVVLGKAWLGKGFPYLEFGAPGMWMVRGMLELEWMFVAKKVLWAIVVCLALYYALVGFALQRPVKRFPFLMFLGVCHAAAIYFIRAPSVP